MPPAHSPEEIARKFPEGNPVEAAYYAMWPPYKYQYAAAWAVMIVLGFCAAVQLVGPEELGISPVTHKWITIFGSVLALVQGFLPKLQKPPVRNEA